MLKFIEFLKNLFAKPSKVYYVRDLEYLQSIIEKDGTERIVLGKDKVQVVLTIKKGDKKGTCSIVADKNVIINEDDIIWLMQKYL